MFEALCDILGWFWSRDKHNEGGFVKSGVIWITIWAVTACPMHCGIGGACCGDMVPCCPDGVQPERSPQLAVQAFSEVVCDCDHVCGANDVESLVESCAATKPGPTPIHPPHPRSVASCVCGGAPITSLSTPTLVETASLGLPLLDWVAVLLAPIKGNGDASWGRPPAPPPRTSPELCALLGRFLF